MITKLIFNEIAGAIAKKYNIATFEPLKDEEPDGVSMLGTPTFGTFIFEKTTYTYLGKDFSTPEIELPSTILSVSYQNNIVETPLKGRSGAIKQYISTSDYSISLDSLLISPDLTYPHDQLNIVNTIASAKSKIKVANEFLNSLNVFDVVIKTFSISQIRGQKNTLQLTMEMVSDLTEL